VHYSRTDGPARIQLDELTRVPELVQALVGHGVKVNRVEPHEPTLEDLYFAVRRERRAGREGAVPTPMKDPPQ
jgi:hypothetical protein